MAREEDFDYTYALSEIIRCGKQEEVVYELMEQLNNKQIKELALWFIHPDDIIKESREQIITRHLYELKVFGSFTKKDLDKIWESI